MRYKVGNSVPLPLQKGDTSIFDLPNEPDDDVGGISCSQTALGTWKSRGFTYIRVHDGNETEVLLVVRMPYKVVNSVSLPLQEGDISIYDLPNGPDHIIVLFHVAKLRSGHGNFVYLPISVCMMEMK